MGYLKEGEWCSQSSFADEDGEFRRQETSFRDWITTDGSSVPDGQKGFLPEKGRYHLYVSYACPWAHRTLIFRHLKQLEDFVDVSVVHPHMLEKGWSLSSDFPESTGDPLYNFDYLYKLYTKAKPDYTGKVTVPVLWDKKEETIVNNESADVIRIFNSGFDELTGNNNDYYPEELRGEIDTVNNRVYDDVNNGVYKAGFAENQDAYAKNVKKLFETLDWLEGKLANSEWLVGDQLTEADIRLFTTLIRFDPVYYVHFKCNLQHIFEYPNLSRYMQRIYEMPEVKQTVHFDHIKEHYYYSHKNLNPFQIVPLGPRQNVKSSEG